MNDMNQKDSVSAMQQRTSTNPPLRFNDLVADALTRVPEIMPWDLVERLATADVLLLDVREPAEYHSLHIPGAINVPRGVLETACEWDYDTTIPTLAAGRDRAIALICRSGRRSALAADVMRQLGFTKVVSLKTGMRGWNDYEQPLVDGSGALLDGDVAEALLTSRMRPEQRAPARR